MLKTTLFLLMAVLASFHVQSQVLEDTRVMHAGGQPALTIVLPGTETKFAEAQWKDFMKPYGKVSRVKKANESAAMGVQILDIGGVNRLNVYHVTESVAEGTRLVVWIDMGGGFVSSSTFPSEYASSVKFLQNFAHKVEVDLIAIELDNQKKVLDKLQSNMTKLQRENENLHKVIEDAKNRIAQAELDIVKNLQEQDLAQKEIDTQYTVVGTVQKNLEDTKARKQN